jgi:putative DNA primase/helicase
MLESSTPAQKDSPRDSLLAAALAHAAAGRAVFPCGPSKRPLTAHGYQDATYDPAAIRAWWSRYPDALIGMPTGRATGLVVLDVDQDETTGKDGEASLAALLAEHGPLPETAEVMTPRGGRHIYFRHPGAEIRIKTTASAIGRHLDIRGDGGYVILPPSVLPDGRAYQWEGSSDPDEGAEIAPMPHWLIELTAAAVSQKGNASAQSGGSEKGEAEIPEGQRNDTLFRLGRSLRAKGLTQAAIAAALIAENSERCRPPLPEEEVAAIAANAASVPAGLSPEYAAKAAKRRPLTVVGGTDAEPPAPTPDRAAVYIRAGELSRVVDESLAILEREPSGIYRQGSRLVRIGRADEREEPLGKREPDAPTLHTMTTASTVDALARHVAYLKWDARSADDKPADPPTRVADLILSREGQWRFPRLIGYTECPCVTADGRLIFDPGYDQRSGLYVLPHPIPRHRLPAKPTREVAERSLEVLREWLSTFPFASESDEAAALAAALTVVHRRPLPAAPVLGITASTPATGKSRLAECFALLATGRKAAFFTAGHTPEELEKRLDVILLSGDQAAVLDNLERPVKSDALCSITTQASKAVRVLGSSRTVDCPTNTALILTGNNLTLLGDLQRRTLLVALDAQTERPEERTFARDALAYTRDQRISLLVAALMLPVAYHAAGRPAVDANPYGSFERWDALIRRPLIWLGMPDPLASAVAMRDEDHELQGMRALYPAWWSIWGAEPITPSTILDATQRAASDAYAPPTPTELELAEAIKAVLGDGPKMTARALGWKLRQWQGRILGGFRVARAPRSAGGVRWALERV